MVNFETSTAYSSSKDWWHLGSLASSFVCLRSFWSFFMNGCIRGDKALLNMFAQGPLRENGPVTQEGLEPRWLLTYPNKNRANTTFKHWKRHSKLMSVHNPRVSSLREGQRDDKQRRTQRQERGMHIKKGQPKAKTEMDKFQETVPFCGYCDD